MHLAGLIASSGTVAALPVIVITPSSGAPKSGVLSFGQQTVGTVSNAQTGTLADTAVGSVLTLSAPEFSGPGAADYHVTVTCNEVGFTTAGAGTLNGGNGAACSYKVIFAPVAAGPANASATMTIATSAPSGNVTFALSGTAIAPYIGRVVWIPDYQASLLHVEELSGGTANSIKVQLPNSKGNTFNPTSVNVNLAYAFVFCSSAAGNQDELLVYDANVIRDTSGTTQPLTLAPLETWVHGPSQLDGVQVSTGAFDAAGNLWYSTNQEPGSMDPALFEIVASDIPDGALTSFLDTPGIAVPVGLTSVGLGSRWATIYPSGMTFALDGSLWISGSEYNFETGPTSGVFGILLNIPSGQFNVEDGPTSLSCVSNDPGATKCTQYTGDFNDPGGVAIFDNMLWVSVTGAEQFGVTTAQPGREIIGFPLTLSTNPTLRTRWARPSRSAAPRVPPRARLSAPAACLRRRRARLTCGSTTTATAI